MRILPVTCLAQGEELWMRGQQFVKSREKTANGREKKTGSREKIIALLSEDGALTMAALARRIGITPKAVEKQIARLKADGILERIGPDKGGRWRIRQRGSLGGKVQ